jgi:hypothetical protein
MESKLEVTSLDHHRRELVATSFVIEVEKLRGAESAASSFETTV